MVVLFKKGERQDPANYRPIALLNILYKVFAKVLDARIGHILDSAQSVDQAGFRPGFGCEDHLFSIVLLAEKASEFQLPIWVAAIDFQKAFDTVDHRGIWSALSKMGVPLVYIRTLALMYRDQSGEIITDKVSKRFKIRRGTKQGDPLSPKIFNAVLEKVLHDPQNQWRSKGWGVQVGADESSRLCNLRFADDLLLVATYGSS
jgi:hypothetical protein